MHGTTNNQRFHTQIALKSTFCSTVSVGFSHTVVLTNDGAVWTKGENKYGQLGDKTRLTRTDFVLVMKKRVKIVAAGSMHTAVVLYE